MKNSLNALRQYIVQHLDAKNVKQQPIQQLTKACLEEILAYLFETHGYLKDLDVFAPVQHLCSTQACISENGNLLKAALKHKKVNTELQMILINAYSRFLNLKQATYHQLQYMEKLQLSIIKLCNQINNANYDDLLIEQLIYFGLMKVLL